jgi:hypothetical protein
MRPLVRVVSALAENVQVPALESAWDRAIGERSAPGEAAGPQGAALVCEDWRGVPGEEQPTRWNAFLTSQRDADLGPSRRARLTVIRLAEADSRIVWTFPEDGLDRGERARLVREVLDDYRSRSGREGAAHPAPDLVAGLEGRSDAEAEAYWRAHLEGVASAPLSIGRGSHGRPSAGRASAREELRLPPDTRSALEALAAEHELPLATWVQGAWSILLSRYGDCEQILFGVRTTTPGAVLHERSLPLRVSVAPHASLLPWLRDLRDRCSSHARFGDVFVDTIRDWCDIPRDAVLFDSETDLERSDAAGIQAAPAVVEDVPCSLSLRLVGGPDLRVCIDYRSDGFERDTIKSLLRHLTNLLEAMGSSPDGRLGDLPMLGVEERHRLLFAWNDTARELPSEQCMHRRFEARVRQAPHAFAVSFEQQRLTYAELNGRANQLARSLRRLGVGPDVLVGICLGRCLESVVAMLGVLKAGGAFVPLDPDYPLARLCFMLRDTRVPVLLTRDRLKDLFARVPEHDPGLEMPKVLRLDADWASIAVESAEDLEPLATPTTSRTRSTPRAPPASPRAS